MAVDLWPAGATHEGPPSGAALDPYIVKSQLTQKRKKRGENRYGPGSAAKSTRPVLGLAR